MKPNVPAKPLQITVVGLIFLAAIFGGFFVVGSHFMEKLRENGADDFEMRERRAEEKRGEKVVAAKEANTDDFQVKALQERLKKEFYEKKSSYADLQKKIAESRKKLTCWYAAESDEDADQVRAYLAYYKRKAAHFREMEAQAKAGIADCDARLESLEKTAGTLDARGETLAKKAEALSRELEQTLDEHRKAQAEYAATPAFRRVPVEKKLRSLENFIRKQKVAAQKLSEKIRENDAGIEDVNRGMRAARERKGALQDVAAEYVKEILICDEAVSLTLSIAENNAEISRLKAEILKCEASREANKIDAYL